MRPNVGTLEEARSGRPLFLVARTVVGRLRACQLQIASASVSALHAQIVWDGGGWQVRDLGSRNGTYVDGRRLGAGQVAALAKDGLVTFGQSEQCYRLVDASAPGLTASSDRGETLVAREHVLCLPSDEDCELTIYRDSGLRWVSSTEAGESPVDDLEVVRAGGREWRIGLPGIIAGTDETTAGHDLGLGGARMTFFVSRDGEHMTAALDQGGATIQLEYRAHLLLLLELARARLADAAKAHLPSSEHGWVYRDELRSSLGIDDTNLNIWAHRARHHLIKSSARGAGALFERRAGSRQIRIGIANLCIA
jgi:hypothetical protein